MSGGPVSLAAEAIVTARDFCGDERAAAVEALLDAGVQPSPQMVGRAQTEAERLWRVYQHSAGVRRPLSPSGRRKAYRDIG